MSALCDRWRPAFAAALDPRFFSPAHLDALIETGAARLWPGEHAAMLTEVRTFPSGARAIHGLVAAGNLEELRTRLIPAAEAWGRRQGCEYALIESREGWARAMRGAGYSPFQTSILKEL